MKISVSITEAQKEFPALVKAAQNGEIVTVARRGSPVAVIIGLDRMSAILESLEILGNPEAMRAINEHKEGKTVWGTIDDIPD